MEDFSRCFGFNRTLALLCCIFCSFLQADGNRLSRTVGSPVALECCNSSINLTQLTWKRNEENLFSFRPLGTSNSRCVTFNNSQIASNIKCVRTPEAAQLNLKMSTSESQLYALIIESAQKTHTGNYTCEMSMVKGGVSEQKWELVITDFTEETAHPFEIHVAVAVIVPCACVLIFIITALIILCKRCSRNTSQSPRVISGEQVEDIYENTLELEARHRRSQMQVHPSKVRAE